MKKLKTWQIVLLVLFGLGFIGQFFEEESDQKKEPEKKEFIKGELKSDPVHAGLITKQFAESPKAAEYHYRNRNIYFEGMVKRKYLDGTDFHVILHGLSGMELDFNLLVYKRTSDIKAGDKVMISGIYKELRGNRINYFNGRLEKVNDTEFTY